MNNDNASQYLDTVTPVTNLNAFSNMKHYKKQYDRKRNK